MARAQPAPLSSIDIGAIRLTYLPDGEGHVVASGMFSASTEDGWVEHKQWLDGDGRVVNTLGGFLIETGDQKIVVDLGFGDATFEIPDSAVFSGGRFLESLSRTKVDPADVDLLLFTHLHVDHTGWTSVPDSDGRRLTFPNARHFVGSGELSF